MHAVTRRRRVAPRSPEAYDRSTGASNVEEMPKLMRRYRDSQEDFDGFIVPTMPARKQQQDTAATLAELARMGVPPA